MPEKLRDFSASARSNKSKKAARKSLEYGLSQLSLFTPDVYIHPTASLSLYISHTKNSIVFQFKFGGINLKIA